MRLGADGFAFALCLGLGTADLLVIDLVLGPRALAERAPVVEEAVRPAAPPAALARPDETPPAQAPARAIQPEPPIPPTPSPAPVAAAAPSPSMSTAAAAAVVHFAKNMRRLDTSARDTIDSVALALRRQPNASVLIAGHADPSGPAEVNQALSAARAQIVANRLRGLGVAADRIRVEAYGARRPLEAPERSRRVEILVVGGQE